MECTVFPLYYLGYIERKKVNKLNIAVNKYPFLTIVTKENYQDHNIFDAQNIVVKQIWHLYVSSC